MSRTHVYRVRSDSGDESWELEVKRQRWGEYPGNPNPKDVPDDVLKALLEFVVTGLALRNEDDALDVLRAQFATEEDGQ